MSSESTADKSRMSLKMQDYLQVVSFNLGKEEYAIEITRRNSGTTIHEIANEDRFASRRWRDLRTVRRTFDLVTELA